MTVNTELATASFVWTGVQSSFACGFPAAAPEHLRVVFRAPDGVDTVLTLGLGYSVSLASGTLLATVTPLAMPGPSGTVIVTRQTPATVPEVLADGQGYSVDVIQRLHDRAAMRSGEDRALLGRAIKLKEGQSLGPGAQIDLAGAEFVGSGDGTTPQSLATVKQLQDIAAAQGNVPLPVLGDVGKVLGAIGAGLSGWISSNYLRFDAAQGLSAAQQLQARQNAGITPAALGFDRGLSVSGAAGALTISLTDATGAAPSTFAPVSLVFASATVTDGKPVRRDVTSALSLTLSSGSTLGAAAINDAFAVWIVAFDDAGTVRLAAINCRNGSNVFPLGKARLASATAEGGAGAADTAATLYAGVAIAAKPYVVLGRMVWEAGLATLGSWVAPSTIELWRPGMALPGDVVQSVMATDSVAKTTTGSTPLITNTTASLTLTTAANLVDAEACGIGAGTNTSFSVNFQLSRTSTFTAIGAPTSIMSQGGQLISPVILSGRDKPNATGPIAYYVFVWGSTTGQWLPNGSPTPVGLIRLSEIQC